MRGWYFKSDELERLADELLGIHRRRDAASLQLPIQAEIVAEDFGLNILWEKIPEEPGTTVFAEIRPDERRIVLNERRRGALDNKSGLYNTTVAHELGHWWLHVDHAALGHDELPGYIRSVAPPRRADGRDRRDERNAGEFMGYLLMPRSLLLPKLEGLNLQSWPTLYRLSEDFEVTITAMKIRLEKLGLTHVDEDGRLHESAQAAAGQTSLF